MKTITQTVRTTYYDEGCFQIFKMEFLNEKEQFHRLGGPAVVAFHRNGKIWWEERHENGLPRTDDWFVRYYNEKGGLVSVQYSLDGKGVSEAEWAADKEEKQFGINSDKSDATPQFFQTNFP